MHRPDAQRQLQRQGQLFHDCLGRPIANIRAVTAGATILVVDDDEMVRRFVANTLLVAGYQVIEADSGETGWLSFEKDRERISLVLSDVMMPGMSGPEMIDRILTLEPTVHVLFMTGTASEARLSAQWKRRVQIVHKPFTSQSLVKAIRDVLA